MMNVLPLFRNTGRPSSSPPTPTAQSSDRANPADKAPRSISKLSLGGFRRSASDLARSTTYSQAATVIQDGSYLQVLSLKLSEGVSKALAQPTSPTTATDALNGRRPIPTGRGREFGSLIAV